ncbi:MAG: hypothetical protein ABIZ80_05575, partial [Bryobacteraceae bacterium]
PQVHAFDDRSLMENLAPQGDTLRTARQFAGSKNIAVTPVTLRPRFNPQQKGPEPPALPGRLPARIDHRQPSLLAAAWTLGSLKYLAENRAASITYFETHGWAGVMETARGSRMPELFASSPGMIFPLYHVLSDAAEFAGGECVASSTSDPLRAVCLAMRRGNRVRVMAANLTGSTQLLRIRNAGLGARFRLRRLDEDTFRSATTKPEEFRRSGALIASGEVEIALPPYAVATADSAA